MIATPTDECPDDPAKSAPGLCGCGVPDSSAGAACSTGQPGICASGIVQCAGGISTCVATSSPAAERCDGLDNSCNGVVDEGFALGDVCTVGVGACLRTGSTVCSSDGSGTQCSATPGAPGVEVCGNGIDEDCNGANLVCPTPPPPPPPAACPQTAADWAGDPASWPRTSLKLGKQTYSQAGLMALLGRTEDAKKDASLRLAQQLIAAKLNVAAGVSGRFTGLTIAVADGLLGLFPGKLPYAVPPASWTGLILEAPARSLEAFNRGALTPQCTIH